MDGSYVSLAEERTYLRFLKFGLREDGRNAFDYRDWRVFYTNDPGCCIVHLGNTTVMSWVKIVPKRTNKPNQTKGISRVDVAISPISYSHFLPNRQRIRILRRQIRQHVKSSIFWSKCVDEESLCIAKGKAVNVQVMHADGNLLDASCLAAVGCLLNAQRAEISVEGNEIIALSTYERTPIALQINHIPVSTTFGFQSASPLIVMDPSGKEEVVLTGSLTLVVNQNGQVCATYKRCVASLPLETIERCTEIAALRAKDVAQRLRSTAEQYHTTRSKKEKVDLLGNLREYANGDAEREKSDFTQDKAGESAAVPVHMQVQVPIILTKHDQPTLVIQSHAAGQPDQDDEEGEWEDEEDEESEEDTEMLHSHDIL